MKELDAGVYAPKGIRRGMRERSRKRNAALVGSLIVSLALTANLAAQTTAPKTDNSQDAIRADPKEFPQWAKDTRRFDIIAFGAFPFAFFTATFVTDSIRWAENSGDMSYAPWPLKPSGSYDPTTDEKMLTIGVAASLSVFIALTDLVIIQIKRHKARKKAAAERAAPPVIIRQPLHGDENADR